MMRNFGLFAGIVFIVSACGEFHTGGAGTMSDGKPISATATADQLNGIYTFSLISPEGWSCTGSVGNATSATAVRTVPLSCSNGAQGNLVLTMNQFADQLAGTFALSNGRTGQVKFGTTV